MNPIIKDDILKIITRFNYWDRFKNKTILISGANGFLPAYMVETFMALDKLYNINLIALVRNKQKAEKRFSHLLNNPKLKIIEHDVCIEFKTSEKK